MPRLLKIVVSTVSAFLGGVLSILGVHFWFAVHRTVTTLLDPAPASSDPDAMRFDNSDPWLDKDFILHKIAAAVILLLGVSILGWAVTFMFTKEHDPAA